MKIKNSLQLQYIGFLKTPNLWISNKVFGLHQIKLPNDEFTSFEGTIESNLRLGKRVERFLYFLLNTSKQYGVLAENIQIQQGKLTVGELDCLLKLKEETIHLEIVYKFYLYDALTGNSELEHWIGPNKKDGLYQKLEKLKNKQLPLLFKSETQPILTSLQLNKQKIRQKVCFKAQLFVPYGNDIPLNDLNPKCIKGFYINKSQLGHFKDCKFYIPQKVNWLIDIIVDIPWMTFNHFIEQIEPLLNNKTSPLCWIKYPNGTNSKCFVVWW